jgi:hypothetical protein
MHRLRRVGSDQKAERRRLAEQTGVDCQDIELTLDIF